MLKVNDGVIYLNQANNNIEACLCDGRYRYFPPRRDGRRDWTAARRWVLRRANKIEVVEPFQAREV